MTPLDPTCDTQLSVGPVSHLRMLVSLLFPLLLFPISLSRRDGVPRHLHEKLRKAHTFFDVMDKIQLIYHPEKTNSHIDKVFPTSSPNKQAVRIVSGSFIRRPAGHRRMQMNAPTEAANTPFALHEDVDSHTADHLSLFSSIRQGNDTCQLQSVCVPVPVETDDPQIVVFPKCYEVMQCVGSCCESYESCHPHSIRRVEKPIVELVYIGNDRFMLNKTTNITMEEHTSCSCLDCGPDPPQCAEGFALGPTCECECKNRADRNNCRGLRTWDEEKCVCSCLNVICKEGETLDRHRCECLSSRPRPPKKTHHSQEADIAALPRLKATVIPN